MSSIKFNETKALFQRVYNDKMIMDNEKGVNDEESIKALCQKVFGDGTVTPDPSLLHQFNNIVVAVADEIAKPQATNLLGLFADFVTEQPGNLHSYTIPKQAKTRIKWSALGSGVDVVRVESGKKTVAVPQVFSTGVYYEPLDLVQNSVENFRKLVNDVADAKLRLYLQKSMAVIQSAITSGKIPSNNVKTGDNLALADFNKVASTIQRVGFGGKPLFIGDSLLIDYFADKIVGDATKSKLLTDRIKEEYLTALNITEVGKVTCVNLVNPFIDESNSKVELNVNEGYFFSGSSSIKPIKIVEYGGLKQFTEQDPEDERIKLMLKQEAAVELVVGQGVGYIKENTAVAL